MTHWEVSPWKKKKLSLYEGVPELRSTHSCHICNHDHKISGEYIEENGDILQKKCLSIEGSESGLMKISYF